MNELFQQTMLDYPRAILQPIGVGHVGDHGIEPGTVIDFTIKNKAQLVGIINKDDSDL